MSAPTLGSITAPTITPNIAGGGEASSSGATSGGGALQTLDDVMRAPSASVPNVVVLDSVPRGLAHKEILDPKEDLWLSTSDGRFNSPIIPLYVGRQPSTETFYVHKDVLIKSEYFKKALCGEFKESESQSINLPEEDPAIFHFLIAYLYEGRFDPIRSVSTVLVPDPDKGKGKDPGPSNGGDGALSDGEDSTGSLGSNFSAHSRRRRDRQRRRRDEREPDRSRQKHPGLHRPNCNCPTCSPAPGPPCWACGARPPPPPPPGWPHPVPAIAPDRRDRRLQRRQHPPPGMPQPPPPPPPPPPPHWADLNGGARIAGEDLRTFLLAYELTLDVYVLANKFLIPGFKRCVARAAVDMLETAGSDAAVPEILALCRKLYLGLPEADPLMRMVFARLGFLQPALWRRAPVQTGEFLVSNPEIAALMLRETAARREEDLSGRTLPSMERLWSADGGERGSPYGARTGMPATNFGAYVRTPRH